MSIQRGASVSTASERSREGQLQVPASNSGRATGSPPISGSVITLFAFACGLAVASISYAQPLLDLIAIEFGLATSQVGIVVTVTQVGYGMGLLMVVPLGDLVNRRRLITSQMLLSALALVAVGTASSGAALLVALAAVGVLAVVTQVLVGYAATLAPPAQRGRIVGIVTSGVVLGILGARSAAGLLADLAGWRTVYLSSAMLTSIVAGALWRVLPRREAARESISYPQLLRSVLTLFVEVPALRLRAGMAAFSFAAFSVLWTSMVLLLSTPPHSLSHTAVGLFGLAGVAGALAAARAGSLVDQGWGHQTTAAALVLHVLAWLPISFAGQSLWALAAGVVVLDLAVQTIHVSSQTVLYAARPQAHSRLVAGYMVFYSIGSGIGSIGSTLTYASTGWAGVCLLGAVFSSLALLLWALTDRQSRQGSCTTAQ